MASLLRALVSVPAWRATVHTVAGMLLGSGAGVVLAAIGVLWWSAVYSLAEGPSGHPVLVPVYVLAAVTGPVALLYGVRFASALQRERFRTLLDVTIAAPGSEPVTGWRRLVLPWRESATWRQLAYHLMGPVLGGLGGGLVIGAWSAPVLAVLWGDGLAGGPWVVVLFTAGALLLAAPWLATGIAAVDTAIARRLLGPGRAEELRQRVESLARSRAELVDAADAERRRIERDLHDGVQQRLVSLALNLGMARQAFGEASPDVRDVLAAAHDEATAALAELRDFVRGLHPAVLTHRGLDAALSGVAARCPVPVTLRVDVATRCAPSIEAIAYFTVSEALTNVARHAAASRVDVVVERAGDRLLITVTDDGCGGADPGRSGGGLPGLARRAAAVDGTVEVVSPPGGPTTVTVYLPCG